MMNNRGVSIVGTVFTLLILGVMGAALVALVAMMQRSGVKSVFKMRAFYASQAGFEYALREIKSGGYPIVADKSIDANTTFTIAINPDTRRISSTGTSVDASRAHSISASLLAKDCAAVNASGATLSGSANEQLNNIGVSKSCLDAVTVDRMAVTWQPDNGEKVRAIQIDSRVVYGDAEGVGSGGSIDITDTTVSSSALIDLIRFSSSISGKMINITLVFTDSSSITVNVL